MKAMYKIKEITLQLLYLLFAPRLSTMLLTWRYFGMVSKLTKNPENSNTGMAVTGPTNVAT